MKHFDPLLAVLRHLVQTGRTLAANVRAFKKSLEPAIVGFCLRWFAARDSAQDFWKLLEVSRFIQKVRGSQRHGIAFVWRRVVVREHHDTRLWVQVGHGSKDPEARTLLKM